MKTPGVLASFGLIWAAMFLVVPASGISSSAASGSLSMNMDEFNYCLRQAKQRSGLRECVGRSAISFLQRFDERDNFTIAANLVSSKDDTIAGRSLVNVLDTDPVDFRGILENAGAVFSQRSLEWHMDTVYPGLMLKIGPTADSNSVAEFVLDTAMDERNFVYDEPSTARILTKQYLLPFLLGLKFNLVALVPLLFATLCLLLKKSLFLAKLAIYVSTVLGVGGAVGAAGGLGGLAGLFSGFGGIGGIGGGLGVPPQLHHGHFPGKAGASFSQHQHFDDSDEFHHNSPYKRNDRKLSFDKPREYVNSVRGQPASTPTATVATTAATDRFYEYEKQIMMQDRSGKLRRAGQSTNGKLGPSAFDEDDVNGGEMAIVRNFQTSGDRLGWKVVDLRSGL